ncbi:isoamylase early set domain-containing protein [bacterium]|nr:isoamylase early set domain-containing protein [bacterium]
MSLNIRYLKSRPIGKVTFRLPGEAAPEAASVHLVGEFNGWNESATPMERLRDGSYKATLDLACGHTYRFRYLIDGETWENDWEAHRYEPTPIAGVEDSVVEV